jgi:hypothetical protein
MNDTTEAVRSLVRGRLMALTGIERLRMGDEMHGSAREIVLASLPEGIPEEERMRRLFLRFYSCDFDPASARKRAETIAEKVAEETAQETPGTAS